MLSYDQAAAKKQWREAVRAIEDAGGVVNNANDARLDAVEEWIGESRQCQRKEVDKALAPLRAQIRARPF